MTGPADNQALPPPPPRKRWMRTVLIASLSLNLAILGMVAGAMLKNGGAPHGPAMVRDVGFGAYSAALSDTDRAALRRSFLANAPEFRDGRRDMRADFKDLLAQLRTVPFDRAALQSVMDRQSTRTAERLAIGQTLIFDLLTAMTPEARQAFADRLEQSLSKGPKRRDRASD